MKWIGFVQNDCGEVENLGEFVGDYSEVLKRAKKKANVVGRGCVGVVRADIGLGIMDGRERVLVEPWETLAKQGRGYPKWWDRKNASSDRWEVIGRYYSGVISEGRIVPIQKGARRVGPEAWRPE